MLSEANTSYSTFFSRHANCLTIIVNVAGTKKMQAWWVIEGHVCGLMLSWLLQSVL